jgi:hypothetical protein
MVDSQQFNHLLGDFGHQNTTPLGKAEVGEAQKGRQNGLHDHWSNCSV